MVLFAREVTRPYHATHHSTTCRVTGTTCRPNVRKWSIDAVPLRVIVCGWLAVVVGCAVIGVTW